MNLINFIVWLCVGAVIGWFASQMMEIEQRQTRKPKLGEYTRCLEMVNLVGLNVIVENHVAPSSTRESTSKIT